MLEYGNGEREGWLHLQIHLTGFVRGIKGMCSICVQYFGGMNEGRSEALGQRRNSAKGGSLHFNPTWFV